MHTVAVPQEDLKKMMEESRSHSSHTSWSGTPERIGRAPSKPKATKPMEENSIKEGKEEGKEERA